MRLLPLIAATYFMVSGGPYGLEDIIGKAGYGRALPLLLVVPLVWSLPTTLMVGELASAMPEEGGFIAGCGGRWGVLGISGGVASLAASVFDMAIYPTIFVIYLGGSIRHDGGAPGDVWALLVVVVCARGICAGLRRWARGRWGCFAAAVSVCGADGGWVVAWVGAWGAGGGRHGWSGGGEGLCGGGVGGAVELHGVGQRFDGGAGGGASAEELSAGDGFGGGAGGGDVCSAAGGGGAGGDSGGTVFDGGWADAARELVGPWLALCVVVGGTINGFGMFNALMMSYTRVPFAMAEEGMLPEVVARKNKWGCRG